MPSPFRDQVSFAKHEVIAIVAALEDTRIHLERQPVWTTLVVEVTEQAQFVFGRLLR